MEVKFKRLTFQNILSFGNQPTTVEFEQGVSLISGRNASGKSSILDALTFCLYGQPYRKIKIKELVNRKNKSNLKVSCEFVVDNRDKYIITRTLSPDSIEITKNDDELELLSSKKLNQDEIDKIIGINFIMFKQVIALAVNYNRPFLSLGLWEKRDIIEQIFNIVVFGQMLKILKKNNVDIKTKNEINDRSITLLEQHLKSLRKRLTEITETQSNFQINKEKDLQINDERIKNYLSDKIKIDQDIEDISTAIETTTFNEEKLNELKQYREILVKSINENEYIVKSATKTIKSLESDKICQLCKTEITPEHKDCEIGILSNEIIEQTEYIKQSKTKRTETETEINQQENYLKELNDNQFKRDNLQEKIIMIDKELTTAENTRNEIYNRELQFNVDSINKEFTDKKEEYKIVWQENKNIKKNLKNNDIIQSILSESGIKAYFFKKLIPILNNKINEYIKMFELPVLLQFDEMMNEKITNLDNLRTQIPYYAYSEGEKKRLDMSILLSFISITKSISNWNSNVLMIDELLDSAIDDQGLEKLVTSLKHMAYESKDLSIYVISHRLQQDYSSQFNNCLTIQKNINGFSDIIHNPEAI